MENLITISSFAQNNVIVNFILLTILSHLNFSLIIDFFLTRFCFTMRMDNDNPMNKQVLDYIRNNSDIVLYRKNGKIVKLPHGKKIRADEKILDGYVAGDEYTLIAVDWNIFKLFTSANLDDHAQSHELFITSYWGGEKSIASFLARINLDKETMLSTTRKLEICTHGTNGYWFNSEHVDSIKKIENIVLDADLKKNLLSDLEDFFNSEKWYHLNAITHKRGYLFYGKPGCGKSSIIAALAAKFGLILRTIDLRSLDHGPSLIRLFKYSSSNSLYLIEDVDAIHSNRENGENKEKETYTTDNSHKLDKPVQTDKKPNISLSDLLNALDGVMSAQNGIIILTTNHIEKIDPALIRPGRIDMMYEFPEAGAIQIKEYYDRIYPHSDIAPNFVKILAGKKFAMAIIQGLAISNKKDHRKFISDLKDLVNK